jgi:hypothetical protein
MYGVWTEGDLVGLLLVGPKGRIKFSVLWSSIMQDSKQREWPSLQKKIKKLKNWVLK